MEQTRVLPAELLPVEAPGPGVPSGGLPPALSRISLPSALLPFLGTTRLHPERPPQNLGGKAT